MEPFRVVHEEKVRFRDLDALGHVNNAVFLTYLETARFEFLKRLGLVTELDSVPMIVARAEIDFRAQVGFGDTVEVGVRCSRVGTKSFDLEYEVLANGGVAAGAKTVMVAYDYGTEATVPVPDDWRKLLAP